jgi:hypothetical protein
MAPPLDAERDGQAARRAVPIAGGGYTVRRLRVAVDVPSMHRTGRGDLPAHADPNLGRSGARDMLEHAGR